MNEDVVRLFGQRVDFGREQFGLKTKMPEDPMMGRVTFHLLSVAVDVAQSVRRMWSFLLGSNHEARWLPASRSAFFAWIPIAGDEFVSTVYLLVTARGHSTGFPFFQARSKICLCHTLSMCLSVDKYDSVSKFILYRPTLPV